MLGHFHVLTLYVYTLRSLLRNIYESLRFGNIMSVVSTRDISAGEEIYVCYNYKLHQAPIWYRNLWILHCQAEHESTVCLENILSLTLKIFLQKHQG